MSVVGRGKSLKIVSACLAGCHCRYDQQSAPDSRILKLIQDGHAVPVCPEQMGGLPTPRLPAEIVGGDGEAVLDGKARVLDSAGTDLSEPFIAGAYEALRMAQVAGASDAILKERSPSCGSGFIYNGSFSGAKMPGMGVTAALLRRHGIRVCSEETLADE